MWEGEPPKAAAADSTCQAVSRKAETRACNKMRPAQEAKAHGEYAVLCSEKRWRVSYRDGIINRIVNQSRTQSYPRAYAKQSTRKLHRPIMQIVDEHSAQCPGRF